MRLNKLFFATLLVTQAAFAADKAPGVLASATGTVRLNGIPAKASDPVSPGSVIETDTDGKATLLLGSRNVVHLDSASKATLTKYQFGPKGEDAQIDLHFGKTRAIIRKIDTKDKKNFTLRTKTAVMGVRGTHVYVDSPKDTAKPSYFLTIEGLAEVRSIGQNGAPAGTPVMLATNQGMAEGATEPTQVSEETVKATAAAVAAPPSVPKTRSEMQEVKEGKTLTSDGAVSGTQSTANVGQSTRTNVLPLDPVANSGAGQGSARLRVKVVSE